MGSAVDAEMGSRVSGPDNETLVEEVGVAVLNQPFFANGNVASAGGRLASRYLAIWTIARLDGIQSAQNGLH